MHDFLDPKTQKTYSCRVPHVVTPDQQQTKESEDSVDTQGLLSPLRSACLYKWEGWWTYEFCFGEHLRQFHQNTDGTV